MTVASGGLVPRLLGSAGSVHVLGPARVRLTGRAEGDLGHSGAFVTRPRAEVLARRAAVVDLPWTWLRQVHGAAVVTVAEPGGGAGSVADAAVTDQPGCALAVLAADCAPVALSSPEGVIGVAHAGWKGIMAGVVQATVTAMRDLGATEIEALVGPCARAECYEFGAADLDRIAGCLGPRVRGLTSRSLISRSLISRGLTIRGLTSRGRPALDLAAAVGGALADAGVAPTSVTDVDTCTVCSPGHYSWRGGRDLERQAVVVWRPPLDRCQLDR